MDGVEERFAFEGDAFFGIAGDDLLIIGVIPIDHFGDDEFVADFESDLIFADDDLDIAFVADEATEFVDALGGNDDIEFVAFGEFDFDMNEGEAPAIGGDHGEAFIFEREKDAIEDVAGVIIGDGIAGLFEGITEIFLAKSVAFCLCKFGESGEFLFA